MMSIEPMPWMTTAMWALTAGCVVVAIVVLGFAFFWNRKTEPRCPKCRYDMRAASTLKCTECGHEAKTALALRRRRPRVALIALALLIIAAVPAFRGVLWSKDRGWSPPLGAWKTVNRIELANGAVAMQLVQRDPRGFGERVIVIAPDGTETMLDDHRIGFSTPGDCTGDGTVDLIVEGYSGGAHCCTTFHVFSATSDALTKVAELDAPNGGMFQDDDGDGDLEFRTTDATWNYAISCYACMHHPLVVMRFENGSYALAPDLMRTDPPTDYEFAHLVAGLTSSENADDPITKRDAVYSEMIKLAYTGHLRRAHDLFTRAWNDDWGDRAEALAAFSDTLEASPFWSGIEAMQNDGTDRLADADN